MTISTAELMRWLADRGISLKVSGGRLVVRSMAGVLTDEIRETLRERKPELIRALEQRPEEQVPLSFGQRQLWFLDQLEGASVAYNATAVLRLAGAIKPVELEQAFDELVRRNEVLRTCFVEHEGMPIQRVIETFRLRMPVVDLGEFDPAAQERRITELAEKSALLPFDLSRDLMVRPSLLRLGESQHVLLITMHHIAGDALSMGLLHHELAQLYEAFAAGRRPALPESRPQYRDYTRWQQSQFKQGSNKDDLEFWRRYLHGAPVAVELPVDRPRPAKPSFRGGTVRFHIPMDVTTLLRELAKDSRATLFMCMLAALKALLARHNGQRDVVVGIPMANRGNRQYEEMIGFFVNTLAVRTDVTGDPDFAELVRRVRDSTLAAFSHGETPFEHVVQAVQARRDTTYLPVYQVMFGLQAAGSSRMSLTGVTIEEIPFKAPTAKHDLTILIDEVHDGLSGGLEYNADIFDRETAEYLTAHFVELTTAVAHRPGERLSRIAVTGEAELATVRAFGDATRVHVVDQYTRPVPIGVPGELVVVNDASTSPQYLGHRARWRPDGRLELLEDTDYRTIGAEENPSPVVDRSPRTVESHGATADQIAGIWSKVLGVPSPTIDEDFFLLGGGSMAIMQVNWELRRLFGVVIPMSSVFENPTIRGLTALVEAALIENENPGSVTGVDGWVRQELPVAGAGHLWNVVALSPRDVWAAGKRDRRDNRAGSESLLMHWDGTTWSSVAHPDLIRVVGIAARSRDDIWLSGLNGLARWDGEQWTRVAGEAPERDCASVIAVADQIWTLVRSAEEAEALSVAIWDGHHWRHLPLPLSTAKRTLHACLSGSALDNIWISTMRALDDGHTESVVLRWDGTSWSSVALPLPTTREIELIRVAALASDDVWVVGADLAGGQRRGVALHWDGSDWKRTEMPVNQFGRLNSVLRTERGVVLATGGGDGDPGILLRWDADEEVWTPVRAPWSVLLGDLVEIPGSGELIVGGAADDGFAVFRGA